MSKSKTTILGTESGKPKESRYLWVDDKGEGRNLYARFRYTFDLIENPLQADLHLFADTSYQMFVNGTYIGFGPIRFDPQHPKYDTYDLTKHLKPGKNTIAVQVNYFGHKTFISMLSQAGFVAWGGIETDSGETVNLSTGTAAWKAAAAPAYRYSGKSSFSLKAADLYDQRLDESDWSLPGFNDRHWRDAVILERQDAWGELRPRAIPYMSGEPLKVESILRVLPLAVQEQWLSFDVPLPFMSEVHEPDQTSNFLAGTTWIYSPREQTATVGTYYQDTWLNDEKIDPGQALESPDRSMRFNQRLKFRKGWNRYFFTVLAYQDIFHHYLALPAEGGFIFSADKDSASPVLARHTCVLSHEQYEKHLKNKPLPYAQDEKLSDIGGWIDVTISDAGQSPVRETSWDIYGEPFEVLSPDQLNGHVFALNDYPHGFSLLLDIGMTWLVHPRVVLAGAGGATVDLTYSEHLLSDGIHLKHQHWYGLGDRAIASESQQFLDWRLTQPRGFRYLKLTVRHPSQDVTLSRLELRSASYPVERRGSFRCSDPLLNEIWEMGARTQEANMEDAYVDCVTRERGQYIRDMIIQYHNNLTLFGDHALMRRGMELFGQSADDTGKFRAVFPNTGDYTISDFALNALEGFGAYYNHTGDSELIRSSWPDILRNMAWFHELADEREDLLLDAEWDLKRGIKAHYGGFHGDLGIVDGYIDNTGIHCIFSCTYLIAMRRAAELAEAIGKTDDHVELLGRIGILERSIRNTFWQPERGCYSDNITRTTHSAHASLFAIRAGVATDEQLDPIRRHVQTELRSLFVNGFSPEKGVYVSPSFSFYIFDGLYRLGLTETAERMMRQGWGWFLQQGLRQTPEYFDLNLSLCHAWSACPTYFLSTHVLGIHLPEMPNPYEVVINVSTSSVTEAEGSVPHSLGDIYIKWHTDENGNRIFDEIRAPEGLKVTFAES